MKVKPFGLVIGILFLTIGFCTADILHLKNGRKIVSENIWEENGIYQYKAYGAAVGIPEDQVQRVEYSKSRNSGFQFDIWPFGATVNRLFDIAQEHDIPLHKHGVFTVNKRYHPQIRKYGDANHFYYNTNLLGDCAKVELFLTPISRQLHTVKIQWVQQNTKDPKLANEIFSMITEKYGPHNRRYQKTVFYASTKWEIGKEGKIEMDIGSNAIFLNYLHAELNQLNFKEIERLKTQKIESGSVKDKNKF